MSKKKGPKRANRQRTPTELFAQVSALLSKQVMNCQDGRALAREHLGMSPQTLFAGAAGTFLLLAEDPEILLGSSSPNHEVVEYLEFACQLLGWHSIKSKLDEDFHLGLIEFLSSKSSPGSLSDTSFANASAYDMLLAN